MSSTVWRMCEGQVVDGKYHLRRLLGIGSYGGVFLADEVVADRLIRHVAVKLIEPSDTDAEGQMRELIAATNLDHPHLLRCYAPGQCPINGLPLLYLVTELAQDTLENRLAAGPLTVEEAREVAQSVASALVYLHTQSSPLAHRDVKPGNIMCAGSSWKLGDFGLLRATDTETTRKTGNLVGTAAYAPPESYEGVVSPAWDIWSLGVSLVEALTGSLPFTGETAHQLMIAIASQEPNFATTLPEPFAEIVRGCLVKDPRTRWTARQVLDALAVSTAPPAMVSLPALQPGFYERLGTPAAAPTETPVVIVAATGSGDYRSIVEALQCAPPNAVLRVRPGRYHEQLVLDRPVEICGEGDPDTILIENEGAACLVMQTERATLRGLTFRSRAGTRQQKHVAVDVPTGTLLLEDCLISCTSTVCVAVHGASAEIRFQRCRLHEGKTGGLLFTERAQGVLESCEVGGNAGAGIEVIGGSELTLRDCTVRESSGVGVRVHTGGKVTLDSCEVFGNAGAGVEAEHEGWLTIRGGHIHANRQEGIRFRKGGDGNVEDCEITGNVLSNVIVTQAANPAFARCKIREGHSNGVWVSENGQGSFEDCEIAGNAFAGVKISQGGNPTVRRSTLHSGKRAGVAVHDKGRGTLADCDLFGNAHANLLIEQGGKLIARRCILRESAECGVLLCGEGVFEECDLFGNTQSNIEVTLGGTLTLRDSQLHDGHYLGLLVHGGGRATVEGCMVYANALPGVAVGEESELRLRGGRIVDGKQVGMVFWGSSGGVVEACEISGNAFDGVVIRQAANPTLRACTITHNGKVGITILEQGAGVILDCDLRENANGAFSIEPNCAAQGANNRT